MMSKVATRQKAWQSIIGRPVFLNFHPLLEVSSMIYSKMTISLLSIQTHLMFTLFQNFQTTKFQFEIMNLFLLIYMSLIRQEYKLYLFSLLCILTHSTYSLHTCWMNWNKWSWNKYEDLGMLDNWLSSRSSR